MSRPHHTPLIASMIHNSHSPARDPAETLYRVGKTHCQGHQDPSKRVPIFPGTQEANVKMAPICRAPISRLRTVLSLYRSLSRTLSLSYSHTRFLSPAPTKVCGCCFCCWATVQTRQMITTKTRLFFIRPLPHQSIVVCMHVYSWRTCEENQSIVMHRMMNRKL